MHKHRWIPYLALVNKMIGKKKQWIQLMICKECNQVKRGKADGKDVY